MDKQIKDLIIKYAEIYSQFEVLQSGDNSTLPTGDQKTGVIGEYYAKCYIEKTLRLKAEYSKINESCDIKYNLNGMMMKVQVKAVSSHSKTRTIAPLNLNLVNNENPFDFLYLISLDKNFIPNGFYINTYTEIIETLRKKGDERFRIVSSVMKGNGKIGSWMYNFENDKKDEILAAIK